MITKIKRCPARPKIPNKKTIFTLKVLSMSRRIENIIEGIKSEDIKELSIEETDINTAIDEFVKTVENETDISNIKDKMNILKNKIFSDEADYENFKDISESIFKELNCNIIKRR